MDESVKARELEGAFREAGLSLAEARGDRVWIRAPGAELVVRAISAGHGRPQEARDALTRSKRDEEPHPAVVVAERFTTGALELLRHEEANYLDDCRFVFHSHAPFIAIDRQRPCEPNGGRRPLQPGLGGRIGVAVQEMLLRDAEWWGVTQLADAANVSPGTAQAALSRLEDLDLVDVEGAGPSKRRRLHDRGAVLDAWTPFARRERRRLLATFVLGQGPTDLAGEVSRRLAEGYIDHAVTGACAALLVAPHVTDVRTCEVWVDAPVSGGHVAGALGAEPLQKGGNVVVLRAKTNAPLFATGVLERTVVANPLRIYADLLEDPRRGEEQAVFLRETVLGI